MPRPSDLLCVEVNAVREPDAARHPARLLKQFDRPQAIHREAKLFFIFGFAKMRVELAVVALGKPCALAHEILGDREGRTGRERDPNLRARLRIVEQLQHPLAVGKNCPFVLNDAVGR